jgi:glycine/D-amino acid oxidase-like deaminating enzyme
VLVVERASLASGATGKTSGIVRCHYGIPSLAAMAWYGLSVFEDADELFGADIGFVRTGYLVGVGPENLAALRANVAMHRELGIDVDLVGHDVATALWPGAALADFAGFAYEPRGGYGDGSQTALAYAVAARDRGARIRLGDPVVSLTTAGEKVVGVRLASGELIGADTVVVAAGPWSVPLLADVGINLPIRVQRESVLLVDAGPLADVPVLSDLVSLQYLRRERSGQLLVGNSDHSAPDWGDPDHYLNRASESELDTAAEKLAHRLPTLGELRLASSYAGCYDVTPDYNPVISATPVAGLIVCAGFSGHGFKISPAVGRLVADLVLHGESRHRDIPASDFRLERFAEDQPLVSRHAYAGAGQMR